MAEDTDIAWTKSTFNPWLGCTKVGPGCDGCYAEALDKRHKWGGATHWGAGVPRHRTSVSYWKQPLRWNAQAPTTEFAGRKGYWPVFCASLADVFDNEVPQQWRYDLFDLIQATPHLSWLLVTKRIGNVYSMVPAGWIVDGFPSNVRLMITIVNQAEADRDIPKLLALPCKNGISYEPALGPIDFHRFLFVGEEGGHEYVGSPRNMLNWIIVGGESNQGKHKARPFILEWARDTLRQCKAAGVPFFMKQTGSDHTALYERVQKDRAGADPAEWPEDLRVQEFPT